MENNPDRFSVIARSRKQVARPHASRARCDPPISARRSPSSPCANKRASSSSKDRISRRDMPYNTSIYVYLHHHSLNLVYGKYRFSSGLEVGGAEDKLGFGLHRLRLALCAGRGMRQHQTSHTSETLSIALHRMRLSVYFFP
ncbi:hypothetical protein EVAR_71010_1 [Eumeta japonica]|uniref:Uncharacterized protein n=1 Tax=Eumeta variegata TaxID=151549 RepID=A0A4C1SDY7_EUMVA|nr:hypothetical protein EVAR_71010_1 [Eumeta japonica]